MPPIPNDDTLTNAVPLTDEDPTTAGEGGDADEEALRDIAGEGGGDGDADAGGEVGEGEGEGEGEGAGEGNGEASADGEGAGEGEDEGDDDDRRGIPKYRFDEVNDRRKAVEAENAQLRALLGKALDRGDPGTETPAKPEKPRDFDAEFDALADRYDNGDLTEAEYRKEERKLTLAQAKAEVAAESETTVKELRAQVERLAKERQDAEAAKANAEWTKQVSASMKAYPFLNHESKDANKDAIAAVRAECEDLIAKGIEPAWALRLAVHDIAPRFAAPASTTDELASKRRAAARKAAGEAENAQPAQLGGTGNGARNQGKERLTASVKDHEKWNKVPESQRDQAFTA